MIMPMRNSARNWVYPEIVDVPSEFQSELGGSSVFTQALFRRGIHTIEAARGFLNPDFYQPAPPSQLPGLPKAVDRILEAFKNKQTILVWGDFDVDGQTSTTLLVSALTGYGSSIHHYIPNRARESHGLSLSTLAKMIPSVSPSVLLTCDTGIDAYEAVEYANKSGIDVIITDHHQLPQSLPDAYAIINPNMLPEEHALFTLPGVGVAYKLVEAMFLELNLDPEPYLDLVALGIVADVAQQTGDTRYLLQKGLSVLQRNSRPGLDQLLDIADVKPENIVEETIGFVIGPRLNALGRLDDANTCVEFFTTSDTARAKELAQQLDSLNSRRQDLTESIYQDAIKLVSDYPEYDQDYPILVLQGPPQWHPGVIGIVASRLVERFHKPVIMLSQEGTTSRGSARSIPGVPISALITESAFLLNSFGGHPMAAGVSLSLENVPQFRRSLAENYDRIVGGPPELPPVIIDAEIPFQSISSSFIEDFQRLAPFGAGNPKLLFSTRSVQLNTKGSKLIGKEKKHKKLILSDSSGTKLDLLWWNSADIDLPEGRFDIAYSLDLTTYKGNLQVQATLKHFRSSANASVLITSKSKFDFLDLRKTTRPEKELSKFTSTLDSIIWAELNTPDGVETFPRSELHKSKRLIIWTTPPSPTVFKQALDRVQPAKVIFLAVDPEVNSLRKFIVKLHGLLKFQLESNASSFDIQKAAQSIAVTPALIQVGLEWIHLHGDYDLSNFSSNSEILPGLRENLAGFQQIDRKLKFLLREVAAYRSYFNTAQLETLL